jgi:NAD(P)-dependent dehydrogenase (short-subunit alcohol dehydrogenase family)
MGKLNDKIALITGSSSGIGKAVALAFAQEGAHLALNYPTASQEQNAQEVQTHIAALDRRAIVVQADVSKEEEVRALVEATMREYGRICRSCISSSLAGLSIRLRNWRIRERRG